MCELQPLFDQAALREQDSGCPDALECTKSFNSGSELLQYTLPGKSRNPFIGTMLRMSAIEQRPQHNLSLAIVSLGQELGSRPNDVELVLALHLPLQDFAGQLHHARAWRRLDATDVSSMAIAGFGRGNAVSTHFFDSDAERAL